MLKSNGLACLHYKSQSWVAILNALGARGLAQRTEQSEANPPRAGCSRGIGGSRVCTRAPPVPNADSEPTRKTAPMNNERRFSASMRSVG
jgi:hypothetical protein